MYIVAILPKKEIEFDSIVLCGIFLHKHSAFEAYLSFYVASHLLSNNIVHT